MSDKHLTENYGLLSHLSYGDQILADHGFNVQESVGLYCAEIVVPLFTRGKKQLSRLEIDKARQLSRVRIHVESYRAFTTEIHYIGIYSPHKYHYMYV